MTVAKIVVPTPNTVITSVWGKSVADALNDLRVQHGFASGAVNASGDIALTYPVAYTAAPTLILTALTTGVGAGSVPVTLSVWGDGSSGTTATVRAARGATLLPAGTAVNFYWLAIGPRT